MTIYILVTIFIFAWQAISRIAKIQETSAEGWDFLALLLSIILRIGLVIFGVALLFS